MHGLAAVDNDVYSSGEAYGRYSSHASYIEPLNMANSVSMLLLLSLLSLLTPRREVYAVDTVSQVTILVTVSHILSFAQTPQRLIVSIVFIPFSLQICKASNMILYQSSGEV